MPNTLVFNWKRLLTEGAVVVFSILLAFAIDALWDERKKNNEIREVLSLVEIETKTNLLDLERSIKRHEKIVAAIQTAHNEQSIASVISDAVISAEVFEPTTDALQTLISTGMLSAIDNVDLRIALIAVDGLAKDLTENEAVAVKFRDFARRRIASLGVKIYDALPESNPAFVDVEVLNLLAMRESEERNAIRSGQKLQAHLQSITVNLAALNKQ
ncbi:MAG: hypothetical protein HKP09_09625 [Enterobacterales bacterium]|nr:hypothetical protein [Enterobacterales bacterium]